MKNNTLINSIIIICLTASFAFGNPNLSNKTVPIKDTIPESMQKVSTDTILEDDSFSDVEKELDELNMNSSEADTTKIRIGKMKIAIIEDGDDIIINKDDDWDNDDWDEDWTWDDEDWDDDDWSFHRKSDRFRPHWAGFTMGLNNYVTADNSTSLPPELSLLAVNTNNSFEVNLNFAQVGLNIIKQRVGLVTGVGFKWNNYKYRNPNTVLSSDSTVLIFYENPTIKGEMSKLTTWYLMVPLLIEFQIPTRGKEFYISAGVEGGLKLSAHTKIKTTDKTKFKDFNDFFTTSLDYRLTARLGYGNFGIYAAYSMMPLFEKNHGPELYPVAVGVGLNF